MSYWFVGHLLLVGHVILYPVVEVWYIRVDTSARTLRITFLLSHKEKSKHRN